MTNEAEVIYLYNGALLDGDGFPALASGQPKLFHSTQEAQSWLDTFTTYEFHVVKGARKGDVLQAAQ